MACTAAVAARIPQAAARVVSKRTAVGDVAGARLLKPTAAVLRAATSRRQVTRQQRGTGMVVRATWGAPVEFVSGKVLENEREAELLQRLKLQIGGSAGVYTRPGMYIQAKFGEGGKAGFFAIASPPGADKENGVVELLVKAQGGTAEELCAAEAGAPLLVSAPMGAGFPVHNIPPVDCPTVLIFATGSGISPIKALIESGALQAGQRRDVRLYYGARSPAHLAYASSIPSWEAAGVKVIPVFSEQGGGYVQDAFSKDVGISDWSGVAAVLCGQKGMAEAVTALLSSNGVPKERILTNF